MSLHTHVTEQDDHINDEHAEDKEDEELVLDEFLVLGNYFIRVNEGMKCKIGYWKFRANCMLRYFFCTLSASVLYSYIYMHLETKIHVPSSEVKGCNRYNTL